MQMDAYTNTRIVCRLIRYCGFHFNMTQRLNRLLGAGLKPYVHWQEKVHEPFGIHLWEMFTSVRDIEKVIVLKITTERRMLILHVFEGNHKNLIVKNLRPELLTSKSVLESSTSSPGVLIGKWVWRWTLELIWLKTAQALCVCTAPEEHACVSYACSFI